MSCSLTVNLSDTNFLLRQTRPSNLRFFAHLWKYHKISCFSSNQKLVNICQIILFLKNLIVLEVNRNQLSSEIYTIQVESSYLLSSPQGFGQCPSPYAGHFHTPPPPLCRRHMLLVPVRSTSTFLFINKMLTLQMLRLISSKTLGHLNPVMLVFIG